MSNPSYPNSRPVVDVIARLREATEDEAHQFWADDQSVLDAALIDATRVHGPRQLTDVYLLALAVKRDGCLVTFDKGIAMSAVKGARPHHIVEL